MPRQLSDWLANYMKVTQRTESPELYHIWSALGAISSALQRKCYCDWGELRGNVYPNMFIALVGPPGGRKGSAMKIAKRMVQNLEIPMGSDSLGPTPALYKEIMDSESSYIDSKGMERKHKSLSIWAEEFQVFLSDRDQTLIPSITDLFDCADRWIYKTLSRKGEDLSNCWLTIIGAITPSLLQSRLSQDAVGGGLISRIIFVVGQGAKQKIALQYLTDEEIEIYENLNKDLQEIAQLNGPFKMDKSFFNVYIRWYENSTNEDGVPNDRFMGYNSRRALHLNKLCMLISASESNDMVITDKHFNIALAILEVTEREMPYAFHGLGMSTNANIYAKMLSFIENKIGIGFNWNELVRTFHLDVDNIKQLRDYADMAVASGLITEETSLTSGSHFHVILPERHMADISCLDKTVFSLMNRNVVKDNLIE